MKLFLLSCAALLVAVSAKPKGMSLNERIDKRFNDYLNDMSKRDVNYPAGFYDKFCDGDDCCNRVAAGEKTPDHQCAHGSQCVDDKGQPTASRYGYFCKGSMCGTKSNQYAGIFCDKNPDEVCNTCKATYGEPDICYASNQTPSGYICLKKVGNDYNALARREIDVMYGEGTARALEQIAKEEAEADSDKESIIELLREVLELEN